jgi:hypothetical protein
MKAQAISKVGNAHTAIHVGGLGTLAQFFGSTADVMVGSGC